MADEIEVPAEAPAVEVAAEVVEAPVEGDLI
jgi:hypothetical protein